jgi:hypothetical protein
MFPLLSSEPSGQDCTAISHSSEVECVKGGCKVLSCQKGYMVSEDDSRCVEIERRIDSALRYRRAV